MKGKQFAVVFLFALSLMIVALAPLSGEQTGSYDPWLDYNGDGLIDVNDLQALAEVYGTSGAPLNLPMALEYDSGWMDISDKQGQNITITHNLNLNLNLTGGFLPRIYGRTVQNDPLWHQRYFEATGYKPGWNKTYGGTINDYGRSVIRTSDAGYALAGYTSRSGYGYDFWLVKTDGSGNTQWNKTYGGGNEEVAYSVVQTSDGGYALAGYSYFSPSVSSYDAWLVKTDGSGNMQWNKFFGGLYVDYAYSVVQTSDGGYALAGYTNSSGAGSYDFWLVKTDAAGYMQWSNAYGGPGDERAYSLVQTSDLGYALAGYTDAGNSQFWLVKFNAAGYMQWSNAYGGPGDERAYSLVQTSDLGYALAGYTSAGSYDFWLVKTDSTGTKLWDRTYGGLGSHYARSVVQTSDGGYALAGYTTYRSGYGDDFWLVKTDSSGTMQWSRTYGGTSSDVAYSLVQTSDEGYALAGDTYRSGYGIDFWLVKVDTFGLAEDMEVGLSIVDYTADTLTLYRGKIDPYWNYVRVRIWVVKENP